MGFESVRMPVIVGPTAGGKTALSIEVARAFRERGCAAEIVYADAFAVYRGMDIGTAKPEPEERDGFAHHLIDHVEPTERFTLHDWIDAAERTIGEIRRRGGVPIVVGGTHLYVKSLLEGVFEGPEPDEALRVSLRAMGLAALRTELERVDPESAARIHPNDERRTVRALEVFRQTGLPISEHQKQWDRGAREDALLVGIEWPTETINRRINARVRGMIERGLVEETRGLIGAGRLGEQAREGLGYKQIAAHLRGETTLEEAVERIKIETRRFAKNQRTWLRRLRGIPGSLWLEGPGLDAANAAQTIVSQCLTTDPAHPE